MDLGSQPSRAQILRAQASIDLHKEHLPPVDRAHLYSAMIETEKLTGKELAASLGMSGPWLSRLLFLVKLSDDLQKAVNEGTLEWTKGALIAQATEDHERQRELAKQATAMTRDAFASKVRKKKTEQSEPKAATLKIEMENGLTITIRGPAFTLATAADSLQRAAKETSKGHNDGLSVKTYGSVLKDRKGQKA
jgi:hypothetical protein